MDGKDDTTTQGKVGSHEANWTQSTDTIEGDAWMRFFWKYYPKAAGEMANGKEEDLRRFREGTRTLVKIMDREVFIAEQIDEKVKEHFAEETC